MLEQPLLGGHGQRRAEPERVEAREALRRLDDARVLRPDMHGGAAVGEVRDHLEPDPAAGEARHADAVEAEAQHLVGARGGEHGDAAGGEVELAVVRAGGALAERVVADDGEHGAVLRQTAHVGGLDHVDRAHQPGALAVPDARDRVDVPAAVDLAHVRAVDDRRRDLLVHRRHVLDVQRLEVALRALEQEIETAEWRARVPADHRPGAQPCILVAPGLLDGDAHQRLDAGHERHALAQLELVVDADRASLPDRVAGRRAHPRSSLPFGWM